MSPLAVFGITSGGLNLVVSLLLLFLVVFWIALVYWTFADARRRISDPLLIGCATAASMFPFAGTIVYLIVRPPEYLEDVRERELEIAAAEIRLAAVENLTCSHCNFEIERSFLRCPSCLRRLKEPCTTCGKPLDATWRICPYCESEIAQAAPQQRRRAAPRERPAAAPAQGERAAATSGGAPQPVPSRQRKTTSGGREGAPTPQREAPSRKRPARAPEAQAAAPSSPEHGASRDRKPSRGRTPSRDGETTQERQASRDRNARRDGEMARDRQAGRDGQAKPKRPSTGTQRPPAGGKAQRPAGDNDRPKRSGAPAVKRPASDALTAEQPVARPRTRPPSAD